MAIQFDKFAAKGHEFIKVLAIELGHPEDKGRAGRVLRSVLHAFRKHLTPEESLQMVSQLPMFLKALYVDGWRLSESPTRINHLEDFIQEVKRIDGRTANNDFGTDEETEQAI